MVEAKKREIYNVMGEYTFTPEEKAQLAQDLANKSLEQQALEDQKKAAMSEFKARIDQKTADIGVLATHLSRGKKCQIFKCWLDFDREKKTRLWKAEDDNRVIKTEPMKPEDAQGKLPV